MYFEVMYTGNKVMFSQSHLYGIPGENNWSFLDIEFRIDLIKLRS